VGAVWPDGKKRLIAAIPMLFPFVDFSATGSVSKQPAKSRGRRHTAQRVSLKAPRLCEQITIVFIGNLKMLI
jgi:hypothetical protein